MKQTTKDILVILGFLYFSVFILYISITLNLYMTFHYGWIVGVVSGLIPITVWAYLVLNYLLKEDNMEVKG